MNQGPSSQIGSIPKWLILSFAAVYLIWGSTYLAIRYAVETIPPFIMAGARLVMAGAILYLYGQRNKQAKKEPPLSIKIRRKYWYSALMIGCLLFVGGNGSVVWAEQFVPSSLAALVITSVPLWMVFLDWIRPNGTKPKALTLVGLVLGFAGMLILMDPGQIKVNFQSSFLPCLVIMGGSLCWASGSILSKSLPLPTSLVLSSSMQMLMGGGCLLAASIFLGEWSQLEIRKISFLSAASFLYLMVIGSIVAFTAYSYLLKNTSAAKVSTYAYVNPIIALFLGWSIASEPVSFQTFIAAIIIISAVVLITYTRGQKPISALKPLGINLPAEQNLIETMKESRSN